MAWYEDIGISLYKGITCIEFPFLTISFKRTFITKESPL